MTASRRRKPKTYVEVLQRTVDEVNAKIKAMEENAEKKAHASAPLLAKGLKSEVPAETV